MELKAGYQRTEMGVLPEDWNVTSISELNPFITSGSRGWAKYYAETGSFFVRITNLLRESIYLDLSDSRFVDLPATEREGTRTQIQEHDVLISITADIGIVAYVSGRVPSPAYINQHIALMRFNPTTVNSHYLAYSLAADASQKRFRALTDQGAKAGMSLITVEKLLVVRPGLEEQHTIAAALSDMDALLEGLERLIAKKRDIKQAAMQQLLTGQTRLPGYEKAKGYKKTEVGMIPQDWNSDHIENFARIFTGGKNTQDREKDGEYPFFVRSQTIERINSYSFDGEAVLTAGDGVGTGKVFHYINGKFDVHQRVYRICDFSERVDGYFFFLYFSLHFYDRIMQMTAKSSVDSVRREMISRMLVPLPPTKGEQSAIAGVVRDMDEELAILEMRLTKTRTLKQAMMQELLTGKTRLVAPEMAHA